MNTKHTIRKAVILASGMGTRISEDFDMVKPLIPLCGVPLIERTVRNLESIGVTDVYIVVGYQKDQIINYLKGISFASIRPHFIVNKNYTLQNGLSLLTTKPYFHPKERFYVTMSDHVFNKDFFQTIAAFKSDARNVYLAVDRKIESVFDIEDATKVLIKDDRIIEIGKNLTDYNAIDTGFFICSPIVFEALEQAKAMNQGDCSLSDGMRILARNGSFLHIDIGDSWWQDIDDLRMYKNAEALLYKGLVKKDDGPVSRHINRSFSNIFTKHIFIPLKVKPNTITIIALLIGLVGVALIFLGTSNDIWGYHLTLAGFLMYQLHSIVDGCDGEVARLTFNCSNKGQWMDNIFDDVVNSLVVFGMGFSLSMKLNAPILFVFGILGFVFMYTYHFTVYQYLITQQHGLGNVFLFKWWFVSSEPAQPELDSAHSSNDRIKAFLMIFHRDVYIFLFFILAIFNLVMVAFIFAILAAFGTFVCTLIHIVKTGNKYPVPVHSSIELIAKSK